MGSPRGLGAVTQGVYVYVAERGATIRLATHLVDRACRPGYILVTFPPRRLPSGPLAGFFVFGRGRDVNRRGEIRCLDPADYRPKER